MIRGDADGASIEFSEKEGLTRADGSEFYLVTLRGDHFEASIKVYAFVPDGHNLPKFFDDLAYIWKGWDGQKKWSSLEGEFELSCEHDEIGHIATTAKICSRGESWTGQISFNLPPGELEEIAKSINRFFEIL